MSFIIPMVFYKGWNTVKYAKVPESNTGIETLIHHLDECHVSNKEVKVRGWATPVSGYGQNIVYARTDKGDISLRTSIQTRTDVSTVMNKPGLYDKSGYVASISLPNNIKLLSVVIVTKNSDKLYALEENCEQ